MHAWLCCRCRQLLSEQEVQARCADAARANVEEHYKHVLAQHGAFAGRWRTQHTAHSAMLSTFMQVCACRGGGEGHSTAVHPVDAKTSVVLLPHAACRLPWVILMHAY